MNKATLTGLIGLLLIVLPYLGIPESVKTYIVSGAGVVLMLFGYLFIRDRVYAEHDLGNGERGGESYVETTESLFE